MAVDVEDLRKLVDTPTNKTEQDLQPFLDTAALIRAEDLAGQGLSDARLNLIELYLAAHFFVIAEEHGGLTRWQNGTSEEEYQRVPNNSEGLRSTHFGQIAIGLDNSGTLTQMASTLKAEFRVINVNQEDASDEG